MPCALSVPHISHEDRCRDTLFLSLREIYRLRDSVPRPFIGQLELEIRRLSRQLEIPRVQCRQIPRVQYRLKRERSSTSARCSFLVRAVRRTASTPPILVSRTTSLSPRGTLFPAACAESISGLLSVNTHASATSLYYTHTPQLRSTRYILPHAVRHLTSPSLLEAWVSPKYRPLKFPS